MHTCCVIPFSPEFLTFWRIKSFLIPGGIAFVFLVCTELTVFSDAVTVETSPSKIVLNSPDAADIVDEDVDSPLFFDIVFKSLRHLWLSFPETTLTFCT